MLLAIDPGRDMGWALFGEARLLACGLGDPRAVLVLVRPDRVVIERPHVRRGTPNAQSIVTCGITAATQAGAWGERGAEVEWVLPSAWKGTLDPAMCCRRVRAALHSSEQPAYERVAALIRKRARPTKNGTLKPDEETKLHNVLDAIGLGLFAVGRGVVRRGRP